jgi:hypothetical protein
MQPSSSIEVSQFVPLTKTDPIVETLDSRQAFMAQYTSLLKHFAVRVCIAVTLGVFLLTAFEVYAFLHFHPGVNATELAAKVETVKNESPAEREYWAEFRPIKLRIIPGSCGGGSLTRAS